MADPIVKAELRHWFDIFRALVDTGAASSITLSWKEGEDPELRFVSTVPLNYVTVSFTVKDNA